MTANKCWYWAWVLGLPLLVACEAPVAKQDTPVAQAAGKAAVTDSTAEHFVCHFETPCYRLEPAADSPPGRLTLTYPGRYRGRVFVDMQVDTLRKQLINFRISVVRMVDKRTGQQVNWHPNDGTPAPAELMEMLPALRQQILAARLQIITSHAPDCVMPVNYTAAVKIQ